jgi:hypothetical protein
MTDAEAADLYAGFAEPLLSFPALVALLLVAAFVGFHLGNAKYRRRGCDKVAAEQVPGGTSLGAMLALLGLQLGFAFSSALGWREARQSTLVDEAMAISTAFLTADLLEDPGRTELQTRILAYAQTRWRARAIRRVARRGTPSSRERSRPSTDLARHPASARRRAVGSRPHRRGPQRDGPLYCASSCHDCVSLLVAVEPNDGSNHQSDERKQYVRM